MKVSVFVFVWFPNFDCYGPFACSVETDVTDCERSFWSSHLSLRVASLKSQLVGNEALHLVFCRPLLHRILSLREGEVFPPVREVGGGSTQADWGVTVTVIPRKGETRETREHRRKSYSSASLFLLVHFFHQWLYNVKNCIFAIFSTCRNLCFSV